MYAVVPLEHCRVRLDEVLQEAGSLDEALEHAGRHGGVAVEFDGDTADTSTVAGVWWDRDEHEVYVRHGGAWIPVEEYLWHQIRGAVRRAPGRWRRGGYRSYSAEFEGFSVVVWHDEVDMENWGPVVTVTVGLDMYHYTPEPNEDAVLECILNAVKKGQRRSRARMRKLGRGRVGKEEK